MKQRPVIISLSLTIAETSKCMMSFTSPADLAQIELNVRKTANDSGRLKGTYM